MHNVHNKRNKKKTKEKKRKTKHKKKSRNNNREQRKLITRPARNFVRDFDSENVYETETFKACLLAVIFPH